MSLKGKKIELKISFKLEVTKFKEKLQRLKLMFDIK